MTTTTSIDLLDNHRRAGQATRGIVAGIAPDKWTAPTNCDMDVRALVNHVVTRQPRRRCPRAYQTHRWQ